VNEHAATCWCRDCVRRKEEWARLRPDLFDPPGKSPQATVRNIGDDLVASPQPDTSMDVMNGIAFGIGPFAPLHSIIDP
jgi:hypothetical protein